MPRVLMDLVNSAKVHSEASGSSKIENWTAWILTLSCPAQKGPILVHCSAGVGRTGTYIAVFKLWLDLKDPKVRKLSKKDKKFSISIFNYPGSITIAPKVKKFSIKDTVLELRKQRCLMVQKKEQYVYIARCVR